MTIRITQGHLFSRALSDIHRGLGNYNLLQRQVATGRRIEKPSDDPAAALRIIPLQNDIRNLQQLSNNAKLARETLDTGAVSLEDASSIMQRVRELTMQAANGSVNANDRASIGEELDQMLQQLVGLSNSTRGDTFLFGGTNSGERPFELRNESGQTWVVYRGNHERLKVGVAPGVDTALNLAGDKIFQHRERLGVTFTGETGAEPYGQGDTAIGFQELEVSFAGLHTDTPPEITIGTGETNAVGKLTYEFTAAPPMLSIDGGPAVAIPANNATFRTANGRVINLSVSGIPATPTGTFTAKAGLSTDGGATITEVSDFSVPVVAVQNSFDETVLQVKVGNLMRTGDELVKHEGTFDAFAVMIGLRDMMRNAYDLDDAEVQQQISQLLSEVDGSHDAVLDGLRELGFRSSSLDALNNRVEGLEISRTESLSQLQDTDLAETILELQRQDYAYQAALQVSARVIQSSLQNFL